MKFIIANIYLNPAWESNWYGEFWWWSELDLYCERDWHRGLIFQSFLMFIWNRLLWYFWGSQLVPIKLLSLHLGGNWYIKTQHCTLKMFACFPGITFLQPWFLTFSQRQCSIKWVSSTQMRFKMNGKYVKIKKWSHLVPHRIIVI